MCLALFRLEQEQELQSSGAVSTQPDSEVELANQRVRELELELAQTKLALVETECKNQDLVHQFNSLIQEQQVQNVNNTGNKSNTWYESHICIFSYALPLSLPFLSFFLSFFLLFSLLSLILLL